MATKRCCCSLPDCLVLDESFDRADSTDLGENWTVVTGSPEIASNELVMGAGDQVATTVGNSLRRAVLFIPFRATGSGSWDFDVILNYGAGTTVNCNVYFDATDVQLTANGKVRAENNADYGQPSNLIWSLADNSTYILEVCCTHRLLYMQLKHYDPSTINCDIPVWDHEFDLPTSGTGLMSLKVNSGDFQFAYNDGGTSYNIQYYRHFDDNTIEQCLDYGCECTPAATTAPSRRWVPWRTRVDIFSDDGTGNGCDLYNGGYLLFYAVQSGGSDKTVRWECYSGLVGGVSYGYGTPNPVAYFDCSPGGTTLAVVWNPVDCAIMTEFSSDTIECEPFEVTYNTVETPDITSPCYPCVDFLGSFYAVMTDDT